MPAKRFVLFVVFNVLLSIVITAIGLWAWQGWRAPSSLAPLFGGTATKTAVVLGSPLAPTVEPSATSGPVTYRVQSGDTLSSIAAHFNVSMQDIMTVNGLTNPNVLSVGQELIIPIGGIPTATPVPPTPTVVVTPPTPIPTATPLPAGAPRLGIAGVLAPGDVSGEAVLLINDGDPARLDGWTLSNSTGSTYTFPSLMLWGGGAVSIHSSAGEDTPTDLYWGRAEPAWPRGDTVTLRDQQGTVQAQYAVP